MAGCSGGGHTGGRTGRAACSHSNARKLHPTLDYADDPIAAAQDADLLLHLTEWPTTGTSTPPGSPPASRRRR